MKKVPVFDDLPIALFWLFQKGLDSAEVHFGRGEVMQSIMVAPMVMSFDKGVNLLSEIAWQVIVFQYDAVLESLIPALLP